MPGCFQVRPHKQTFPNAENSCNAVSASLPLPRNQQENDYFHKFVLSLGDTGKNTLKGATYIWLGTKRLREDWTVYSVDGLKD